MQTERKLVRDIISGNLWRVSPQDSMADALRLMVEKHIHSLPVIENEKLVGIITDSDIRLWADSPFLHVTAEKQFAEFEKHKVKECMQPSALVTVEDDAPIVEAAKLVRVRGVGGVPVTRGDKVVGYCTRTDLVDHLIRLLEPI